MKNSKARILTTHVGSLPRPAELVPMLFRPPANADTFNVHVRAAVAEAVRQQVAAGIDIISDGEQGKPGFHLYALARLSGCEMTVQPGIFMPQDVADHPDLPAKLFGSGAAQRFPLILCNGAITMRDPDAVHRDIANFKATLDGVQVEEAFMTAVSPGSVAALVRNNFYRCKNTLLCEHYALLSRSFLSWDVESTANRFFG